MIARARALLGTLVAIRAEGPVEAVEAAFAAVEAVHRLMGPHSEEGDLVRIHRYGHLRAVGVHPWTYDVLACAREVSAASEGAFDVTLRAGDASFEDVELLPAAREVRLRRPARLDLGGIAKGYAVDRAVDALARHGCTQGCVNAGGDLRLFGPDPQEVRVRLPGDSAVSARLLDAREGAFATSGSYFGSEPLDARTGRTLCRTYSITVAAPSCVHADALTKAVAAIGPVPALLEPFGAKAFLLDEHGTLHAARA